MADAISISAQLGLNDGTPTVIDMPVVGGAWVDLTQAEQPNQVDLATREAESVSTSYFLRNDGSIEWETPPTSASPPRFDPRHPDPVNDLNARFRNGYGLPGGQVMLSQPTAEPEPDAWGLTPVMETAERTAAREAFLADYDAANPHIRARNPSTLGRPSFEPTGVQRVAGMTWADGSPVMGTDGRPIHTGEFNDVESEPIHMGDPRQAERRAIIAADRRRRMT